MEENQQSEELPTEYDKHHDDRFLEINVPPEMPRMEELPLNFHDVLIQNDPDLRFAQGSLGNDYLEMRKTPHNLPVNSYQEANPPAHHPVPATSSSDHMPEGHTSSEGHHDPPPPRIIPASFELAKSQGARIELAANFKIEERTVQRVKLDSRKLKPPTK